MTCIVAVEGFELYLLLICTIMRARGLTSIVAIERVEFVRVSVLRTVQIADFPLLHHRA